MICQPKALHKRTTPAFVLDIDGTLDTGIKGDLYRPVFPVLSRWLARGAKLVFITNRPTDWVSEQVLRPLVSYLAKRPAGQMFLACEQGSIISRLEFPDDDTLVPEVVPVHSWRVPNQRTITQYLRDACRAGKIHGRIREEVRYQVCFELSQPLDGDPLDLLPDWLASEFPRKIRLVRTRNTLTFVHADAAKDTALRLLIERFPELADQFSAGEMLGFGDDGDDFARIVPTIDVDTQRRKSFQKKGLPSVGFDDPELFEKLRMAPLPDFFLSPAQILTGAGRTTTALLLMLLAMDDFAGIE